jgi:hypothetical protein
MMILNIIKGEVMIESIISMRNVSVVIINGSYKGVIGIIKAIDENQYCQIVEIDGIACPIRNEWINIID